MMQMAARPPVVTHLAAPPALGDLISITRPLRSGVNARLGPYTVAHTSAFSRNTLLGSYDTIFNVGDVGMVIEPVVGGVKDMVGVLMPNGLWGMFIHTVDVVQRASDDG
mgnify:CR=1 FL=1